VQAAILDFTQVSEQLGQEVAPCAHDTLQSIEQRRVGQCPELPEEMLACPTTIMTILVPCIAAEKADLDVTCFRVDKRAKDARAVTKLVNIKRQ
jgi:hypothetical protein